MRQSTLFTKTLRSAPKDEQSANAQLFERGGFIYKNSAGVYTFLPLGWRVIQKIAAIIREEMNAIGGQELFMPALVERRYLEATGRWDVEVGFEARGRKEERAAFSLGWTHEEVLTEIASKYISSYKDLPLAAYQIQTKFRNEPRAKSGLLRGREFIMKDLYSFHASDEDFERYYAVVAEAYHKIFSRCGLQSIYTVAAGGTFTSRHTHEFQVLASVGEDTIYVCTACAYAENGEISKFGSGSKCPKCSGRIEEKRAIEVGNIFPLGTKYSKAFNLQFVNAEGKKEHVVMGSYGIGLGRVMGAIAEVHHDDKGIIWPESVAPFTAHILVLPAKDAKKTAEVKTAADTLYEALQKEGIEVLYDDRGDASPGEKFADCDLLGVPWRLVVSEKTIAKKSVEAKRRDATEVQLLGFEEVNSKLKAQNVK